ncbi:MAG: hypothetical protein IJL74_03880 [Bacilli bacterium]|nr:hypothetical protein [Bacilli bacterium]
MKKRNIAFIVLIIAVLLLAGGTYLLTHKPKEINVTVYAADFNSRIIREVNKIEEGNYLISPYSIEIALNMLRDGANGETKNQIDKLISKREINNFKVKNRINVANAAFIKNEYKENVVKSYYTSLKEKYNATILYDQFKTPKVMNDWVNKETDGMIKTIINRLNPNFAMAIANAVAIDVEWRYPFECTSTTKAEFTKYDNSKYDVAMMHKTYRNITYFDTDKEKGIVLPYNTYDENGKVVEDGTKLEFVGILPNSDIKSYVNNITKDTFDRIDNNMTNLKEKEEVRLSLPMFKYEYQIKDFIKTLKDLGIKEVFDDSKADLSNMIGKEGSNFYVSDAIHKTYIDLNEKGTKAAAVTAFFVAEKSALPEQLKTIEINFNKPFVYMIRDSKTKEVLFFGVIYEPSKWEGSTCK